MHRRVSGITEIAINCGLDNNSFSWNANCSDVDTDRLNTSPSEYELIPPYFITIDPLVRACKQAFTFVKFAAGYQEPDQQRLNEWIPFLVKSGLHMAATCWH